MDIFAKKDAINALIDGLSFRYHYGNYDQDTGPHRHEGRLFPFAVIVCPTRGEYFGGIGNQLSLVRPHEALVVPPGAIHKVEVKERCFLQYAHLSFSAFHTVDLLSLFHVPLIIGGKSGASLEKWVRTLSFFFRTANDSQVGIAGLVEVKRMGLQILEEIIHQSEISEENLGFLLDLQKIRPALDHIKSHAHEAITLDGLAGLLDMAPYKFKQLFFTVMRKTPLQYIRQFRIRRAQDLLAAGDLSVKEVAARAGYRTIFYFSRDFKNAIGKSPLDYRRDCRLAMSQIHP